ncbi:general secretion pathway protein GspE [Stigmatella erecta]|uniref:Type II secretion system (T2SS), protein E, N-terminal domain n=1 Tax=Stigmatella erecta TaxID=83460 RepID=A0A1I0KT59_9BACT|nr:general secretion pathway protein GspE [Stigmatella erecta]SEU28829.1 Type II secretion system (T2SS), protein E, N-terminal domain [Stigmatella erecta]
MRLGELLIQEKLISPQGLEEALESQVVHGGRLGTNLLELGLIAEKDLARMLGQLHGCAHASGELAPDPQALKLVNLNDADKRDYLPMRVDATRLSLAVINPQDYAMLDALAFKTGKRVVPVIVPEFRMNQSLRRYCKAFRPLRAVDMNTVRPSKTLQEASGEPVKPTKGAGTELISEEEFQSVYAQALTGGARSDQLHELLEAEEEVITGEEVAYEAEAAAALEPEPAPEAEPAPSGLEAAPAEEAAPNYEAASAEEDVITGEEVYEPTEEYAPPEEEASSGPARTTIPMWTLPADLDASQLFADSPPVPDVPAPQYIPPVLDAPPPSPPEPLPFIPDLTQPAPAHRPTLSFIPVPSDVAAPSAQAAALPPVAPVVPPVVPPVAPVVPPRAAPPRARVPMPPVAKALPAVPGKAAPRKEAAARPAPPPKLSFAEAQAQLAKSIDREDVATTVLRYAMGKWRRCLLLSVQGSLVTGWHGMGKGVREGAVRRIGVALREQSTFRLVRDTRSHYVGPVRRDAAMAVFYRLLGADKRPDPTYPKTAVILPLLVRGKVVHLLYLDNGPDQLTPPTDVGELLILAQSVGRSYEAMIRRRKSA